MKSLLKKAVPIILACLWVSDAMAQAGPGGYPGSETDPVYLFNEVCYSQVPDVAKIQDMAKRFAWNPMGGKDLERFTTLKQADLLEGWDIRLAKRIYRVGIVRSEPTDSFLDTFPDMADGVATSCTMVLDGRDDAALILDRLNALIGKQPTTQGVPDGQLTTTTWAGGNDAVKVFVFFKADGLARANLMNVTIVTK